MRPFQTASATFRNDQTPSWEVSFWDTTCTVPQTGLEISLFDILDPTFNLLLSSYSTKATLDALLNANTPTKKFRSVLGYGQSGARSGLEPNLYKYWGPGAPAGCKTAKRVFLKYKGKVVAEDTAPKAVTLVFGGQGKIRVFKNGTSLASGALKEPLGNATPTTSATIASVGGYLVVETTLAKNDTIEVYYANNGESWGGIVGKVIPGTGHALDWNIFRTKLRDAPVIGAGFLSSATAEEVPVPYCISTLLQAGTGQIPVFQVEVATAPFGEVNGFRVENVGGMNQLIDNTNSSIVLRPGRLMTFEAGFDANDFEESYPRFTGRITSITPSRSGESATITCHGIEHFLESNFDENNPDMLSYIANGFIDREWKGYPVFGIPAFDAWPLETVLADLCARAGIDATNLGKSAFNDAPDFGKYAFNKTLTGTIYRGQKRFYARSLSDSTELVTLQRNSNYGNIGMLKKDYLPNDDPYIFPSKVSDRLWDHASEMANQFGYDFFFDAAGQATIGSRNNPQSWQFFSNNGDSTQSINPSAIGGRYYRNTCGTGAPAWSKQFTVHCSRVDLYCGIGYETDTSGTPTLNGGLFQVAIDVHNGTDWVSLPSQTRTFSTYNATLRQAFFYDDVIAQDGSNAAVFTLFNLPFDKYRVTITPVGPSLSDTNAQAVICLNGIAVFERDPNSTPYETPLSTLGNVLDFYPSSNEKDLRNHVIVVGQRKADVTDSAKFSQDNPNNPFTEFYVSVAADPLSIYDPTAVNFTGGKRMAVIVDDKVTDSDFAKWLARTALYRFNMPKLEANISHTAIPQLEIRDPIRVVDEQDNSIQHLLWVERFQEKWNLEGCDVDIDFTAYPELPSYTPREDIDIEALFQSSPAYNVSASYKNIYGFTIKNIAPTTLPTITKNAQAATAGSFTLPGSAYADNTYLSRGAIASVTDPDRDILVNHPYRRFWTVAPNGRTMNFDFQEGDGTSGVYDQSFYGFPSGWQVNYESFTTRSGGKTANPFYDPYTSESGIGNLVSVKFDSLVSGFYRVSLWAVNQNGEHDFPVAYLTHPEGNPEDEDAHWTYMEAGSNREFLWDGSDSVGLWNRYQSKDFAKIMEGSFDDKAMAVGKGFYVWNDQATNELTQIGDNVTENMGPDNRPFFTRGKYSRFYVKIEAKSDRLARKGSGNTTYSVNSHNDLKVLPSQFYIYTHLGEPTQVKISIEEWDANASPWTQASSSNSWLTPTSVTTAQIKNGRPVRVSFQPVPRRGVLFYNESNLQDDEKISAQLFRTVHLKLNVFDQFWTFYGKPWDGEINDKDKSNKNSNNKEAKRLTSRMNSDDTHTIEFSSSDWLSGKDFKNLKWIFQPDMFKKDWGDGVVEALRYGDYEQLYTLPGYDIKQGGGTARADKAFITLAFINYLFYLSAHTLDRSGRRQFCLNTNFIDKSKIVTPTWLAATPTSNPEYCVSYPRFGADTLLIRTIFTRQWVEPTWATGALAGSPVSSQHAITGGITDATQLKWVQPSILDFNPFTTPMNNPGDPTKFDRWSDAYMTDGAQVNIDFWNRFGKLKGQNPKTMATHSPYYRLTNFGSWNFDRYIYAGFYNPSPCRDFMPYWREPGMPDWASNNTGNTIDHQWTNNLFNDRGVNVLEAPVSFFGSVMRDIPAQANWFGYAFADSYNPTSQTMRGARLEEDVVAWAHDNTKGAEFAVVFDYVRQDTLNRFDMFRGVISRSPLAKRQDFSNSGSLKQGDAGYWQAVNERQAGSAPVKPSGVYLLNLGNYYDYIVGPATAPQYEDSHSTIHLAQDVENFFDIRFRHEYVWYSARYFPVYAPDTTYGGGGGAKYWAFRDLTGRVIGGDTLYDAGAWTGHKDDLTISQWNADSHLRWLELYGFDIGPKGFPVYRDGSTNFPFVGGGYPDISGNTFLLTGRTTRTVVLMGQVKTVQRVNFFAETHMGHKQRLAVGPRTPETRSITMNLVLPSRFYR